MQRNGSTYTASIQVGNAGTYSWSVSGGGATSETKTFTVADCTTAPR
jgi:hypothetical protein